MDISDAKILFDSHIREDLYPSYTHETLLVMVSKTKVIHVYSHRDEEDDYKIFVLTKERDGRDIEPGVLVRKYDVVDIAKVISNEGFKISMINSKRSVIEKLISKNILNHNNTFDPRADTPLKKLGSVHNYYYYTHDMVGKTNILNSEVV